MDKFCIACGASINAQAKFCGGCGQPTSESPTSTALITDQQETTGSAASTAGLTKRKSGLIIVSVVALVAVSGVGFYTFGGIGQNGTSSQSGGNTADSKQDDEANAQVKYLIADANIRTQANAKNAAIVAKLQRGTTVIGFVKRGDDPTSQWLKLSDDRGYISLVNLADAEPPKLTKSLNDQSWFPSADILIKKSPDAASPTITTAKAGNTYYLAGVTENGFVEVKLGKGGVGYVLSSDAGLEPNGASSVGVSAQEKLARRTLDAQDRHAFHGSNPFCNLPIQKHTGMSIDHCMNGRWPDPVTNPNANIRGDLVDGMKYFPGPVKSEHSR